ncbi:TRAP transporter small permease [Acuticoccus sp. MNP-M23]|uniref:TRAP transporter small permease n=1 Tax=Acuticoccus sp. MNP-M23 TaxID=3072793 RepID=UPI00281651BA|nr:TRAP transporter small permease [Acuticoccus sp. MNP-M23]WMS43924.1 TRAP transporter small permease [Acuticoccus sp. MNP-M23]
MKALRFIEANLERYLLAAILLALVVILAMQVFARYVVGAPLVWSEELARYLLIWCTFIGVSLAVREGRNISVDLLPTIFGPKSIKAFTLLALAGSLIFFVIIVWYSIPLTQRIAKIGQRSPGLNIQMWTIYAAAPVGFSLAALRAVQAIWLLVSGRSGPTHKSEAI